MLEGRIQAIAITLAAIVLFVAVVSSIAIAVNDYRTQQFSAIVPCVAPSPASVEVSHVKGYHVCDADCHPATAPDWCQCCPGEWRSDYGPILQKAGRVWDGSRRRHPLAWTPVKVGVLIGYH